MLDSPPMIKLLAVLLSSYSFPLIRCADMSAARYITSDVHSCVTYGLLRCARAYASAARVSGPKRCHRGSAPTVLGVGTASVASGGGGLLEFCRTCVLRVRFQRRLSMRRRRRMRQGAVGVIGEDRRAPLHLSACGQREDRNAAKEMMAPDDRTSIWASEQ